MAATGTRKLLLVFAVALLAIGALVAIFGQATVKLRSSRPSSTSLAASSQPLASANTQTQPAAIPGAAQTGPAALAGAADSGLLSTIEKQAAPVVRQEDMASEATRATAMRVWIAQDAVVRSWPTYQDAQDELRRELAGSADPDNTTIDQLRAEASRLQAAFWEQEAFLSPQGYRPAYKARLLMEIAHEREPGNLAVADELVDAMQTGTPVTCYDPETKRLRSNQPLTRELQALRADTYARTRKEVEQGREFTWADFARAADYTHLWSDRDPQKATDAFEWACSHTSGTRGPGIHADVLTLLSRGRGASFGIYYVSRAKYPREYSSSRRLPSYRGPNPEARGLVPIWTIGPGRAGGGHRVNEAAGR